MPESLPEKAILGVELEQAKNRRPKSAAGKKARLPASPSRETRRSGAPCDRTQAPPRLGQRAGLRDYQGVSAALGLKSRRTGGDPQQHNRPAQSRPQMRSQPQAFPGATRLKPAAWAAASAALGPEKRVAKEMGRRAPARP